MIVAVDAGGYQTKFYDGVKVEVFPSLIGYDWRERKLSSKYGSYDYEFEYRGIKGFAGTLAQYESDCVDSRKGDTKAHDDARLRVLIALHQFGNGSRYKLVVGQPIGKHTEQEKKKIKSMLLGTHLLKINHVEKEIVIDRVEVAAEGVAAGLLIGSLDLIRIIDIGSGTVNYGTMINRKFNDKGSFTLATGMETTLTTDYIAFTRQIALRAIQGGWQPSDKVYLVGGGADKVISYITDYFPLAKLASNDVIVANVQAFHMIARKLYG